MPVAALDRFLAPHDPSRAVYVQGEKTRLPELPAEGRLRLLAGRPVMRGRVEGFVVASMRLRLCRE